MKTNIKKIHIETNLKLYHRVNNYKTNQEIDSGVGSIVF